MGSHERMSVRHSHWGIVSVPAWAVMLWIGVMPGAVPDATSVQEQRIEIAIRNSVYERTKTTPILAGVLTYWSSATRTRFGTPEHQGKITFRCDLHPSVQGEIYLLDVPVG